MSKVITIFAVLALALASTPAWAGCPCGGHGPGGPGGHGKMGPGMGPGKMAALNLTADQQKKVEALKASQLQKATPVRAQLEVKGAEMKALWDVQNPDKKAILAKQAEMDGLRKQIRELRVDFRLEMLKILTPEQRAAFQAKGGKGGEGGCPCGGAGDCGCGGPGAGPGGCNCGGDGPGDCGCKGGGPGGCGKHHGGHGGKPI